MDDLIEKYKSLGMSKRAILILALALAYPCMAYLEESESLDEQLNSAIDQEASARTKLRKAKTKLTNLPALDQKIESINKKLEKARKYLPKSIDFGEVLSILGTFEKEFEVHMAKFQPGTAPPPGELSYIEVPLNVELVGEFSRVMIFLDRVVHLKNLVQIKSIDFKGKEPAQDGKDKKEEPGTVSANVNFVFYQSAGF